MTSGAQRSLHELLKIATWPAWRKYGAVPPASFEDYLHRIYLVQNNSIAHNSYCNMHPVRGSADTLAFTVNSKRSPL